VLEARETIGGGIRTAELTLPGFAHDVCSGCHPMGALSPYFRVLPLAAHGLSWIHPPASVAHPLDRQPAVLLRRSLDETAAELGATGVPGSTSRALPARSRTRSSRISLAPVRVPRHPFRMARFGLQGLLPATTLFRARFRGQRARALMAGCAAHSILPLERPLTAAVGMIFALTGHVVDWPVAAGGSRAIGDALASYLRHLGGTIETDRPVRSLADVPPARVVLFDTNPGQLADIGERVLPAAYVSRLRRYRYGPGAFKIDWALDGPIPWRDPRCLEASTIHLGGTLDEIAAREAAVWRGEHPERPFVLLVQQSQFDPTRAPAGRHTGYAYCHVPAARPSTRPASSSGRSSASRRASATASSRGTSCARRARAGEPELRRRRDHRRRRRPAAVLRRPVLRLDPYSTPNPRLFLCSRRRRRAAACTACAATSRRRSALRSLKRLPERLEPLG
jgi:phytoene dehydrogenase-like protein